MNYLVLFVLIAVGLYDLWLVYTNQATLSQRYQKYFPKWVDMIVFCAMLVMLILWMQWIDPRLKVIIAAFGGHLLFPNKETFKK